MYILRLVGVSLALLILSACMTSPQMQTLELQQDVEVARILAETSQEDDARRCLRSHEYRSFEILDERRIIFKGSRDRLWLNQLRARCPGLRSGRTLKFVNQVSAGRICDLDSFEVLDFFYLPRFRRWPWQWFSGVRCTLGDFEPITEQQAHALKAVLKLG